MRVLFGDLIQMAKARKFDFIAHGCNCQKVMGAGIAAQIAHAFPDARTADHNGQPQLGSFTDATVDVGNHDLTVVNLYTQFHPGANFDLGAFRECCDRVVSFYGRDYPAQQNRMTMGLPLIGAGIGGGNWADIERVILEVLDPVFSVTVVHWRT